MLDALMGPGRDVQEKDRTNDDFTKDDCCKHYLVGFCPNGMLGKKLDAIKKDPSLCGFCPGSFYKTTIISLDGCPLLHNKGLRTQMDQHPEAAKYKKRYEQDLQRFIGRIIKEADSKSSDEKRKRELGKEEENEHGWVKTCDECGMTYKLAKRKPQTDGQRRTNWAQGDQQHMPGDWHCPRCKELTFACNDKCIACDHERTPESKKELEEYMNDVQDPHAETEVHKGYVKLREKLAELNVKYEGVKDEEPEGRPEKRSDDRRERTRSRSRERRRQGDRGQGDRGQRYEDKVIEATERRRQVERSNSRGRARYSSPPTDRGRRSSHGPRDDSRSRRPRESNRDRRRRD